MTVPLGTRIGAYEVTGQLGAGGMGEVYRARDTKLDRDVAIKILPPEFATDAERVARFRREARTLAALNHPHIAHVHGLEETADGALAIAMELVEGEDLAQRLTRGAIPIDEALPIAKQIAEALEAAHEQGIVHRDLKPANIKVRDDGKVKVLDFGLAKAIEPGAGSWPPGAGNTVTNSPTITTPAMTMRGVILGTAAYMAPEQAKGKPVDRRADIWAFGCVLYEMLTGARAFDGEDTTEILGAIVKTDPDWSRLPASTPAIVVALIRRCLQKDARARQQHIGDARIELGEASAAPAMPVTARRWSWLPWSITAAASAIAIVLSAGWPARPASPAPAAQMFELLLPDGVEQTSGVPHALAISPDGRRTAIVGMNRGVRRVYVREATAAEARELPGTENAVACGFSPDSQSMLVVINTGRVAIISLADGLVRPIASGADVLYGAVWATADRIALTKGGSVWLVSTAGGEPELLAAPDANAGERAFAPAGMLPNGVLIVLTQMSSRKVYLDAIALRTRARTRVLAEDLLDAVYSPSGHLLMQKDGHLVVAAVDLERLTLSGSQARFLDVGSSFQSTMAVSDTGTLVLEGAERQEGRLMWVGRDGVEQAIESQPRQFLRPRLSPDGTRIAFSTVNEGVWVLDTVRRSAERVFGDRGTVTEYPIWSRDGRGLFALGPEGIYRFDLGGGGAATRLINSVFGDFPASLSPDGLQLGVQRFTRTSPDIYALAIDGSAAKALVDSDAFEAGGVYSPDGRWIGYVSDESGRPEVYIRSLADGGKRYAISVNGGAQPMWRGDGRELFYREGDKMMAVAITLDDEPTIAAPVQLFERRYTFGNTVGIASYDVTRDGRRFVMIKDQGGRAYLRGISNITGLLNQLAPVKR